MTTFTIQPVLDAANTAAQQYTDDIAAKDHIIETLTQKVHDLTPKTKIMTGFNASNRKQYQEQMAIFGDPINPVVIRYYQNPGEPIAWPTEVPLRANDGLVYSSKDRNPTVAKYVAMLRQAPRDGRKIYVCPWHEPENDGWNAAQIATYLNWFAILREAVIQVGNPNIMIACILMGYTWQKASKRNPEDWIPDDEYFDILLVDQYFAGSIGQSINTIPKAYDDVIATAKAHNKPWGAAETGVGPKAGNQRNAATLLVGQTLVAKGAELALWFQTGATVEWSLDAAGAKLFKQGLGLVS